jgi:hypothetical protein
VTRELQEHPRKRLMNAICTYIQEEVVVIEKQPERDLRVAVGPSLEITGGVVVSTEDEYFHMQPKTAIKLAAAVLASLGFSPKRHQELWAEIDNCHFTLQSKPAVTHRLKNGLLALRAAVSAGNREFHRHWTLSAWQAQAR